MVQSLTDWLKQSRLIVVAVEMDKGRVRVKGEKMIHYPRCLCGSVWACHHSRPGISRPSGHG